MPFGGLLTMGLISGGSSLINGILGKNAADKASQQQVAAGDKALQFEQGVYGDQKQNFADYKGTQSPYLNFGTQSIGQLMGLMSDPRFGQGKDFAAPDDFKAPTLEEARNTPGYQFARQQGSKGILQGASAAGGAITGGTLKALGDRETSFADTTYNDVFSRAMSTYNTNLTKNEDAYKLDLANNNQNFQQLFAPAQFGAQLGEGATSDIGHLGSTIGQGPAASIGDLMTQIGNAQAAGTVGGANAITGGIAGGSKAISDAILLDQLKNKQLVAG